MKKFLILISTFSLSFALKANCIFEGDGVGEVVGEIILTETETPDGSEIEIAGELLNLSPGLHGFHIHENGDLSDDCKGSGGHYNPNGNNHGAPGAEDRHVGDLGNIASSDKSVIGRAIVVHEGTDDLGLGGEEDSLTTGHAG